MSRKYWINTISRDHTLLGVQGGFTQANHGRASGLRRLSAGDLIAFYSPRTSHPEGEPVRRFTALGRVADNEPYQVEITATFHPWRRRVQFVPVTEAPVESLLAGVAGSGGAANGNVRAASRTGILLFHKYLKGRKHQMQARSSAAARTVAAVAVALGLGSLVYRLLHASHLDQTAALFIGLPSLLAFAAAFVALRLHADTIMGITFKTITVGLLLSGPVLGEGFICVLLAAPLFYAVGLLVAWAIQTLRRLTTARHKPGAVGLLVLPLLVFGLEGTLPALGLPRQSTSIAERIVLASPTEVEAALSQAPDFGRPLPAVLQIGFPRPVAASGQGLDVGDRRSITFASARGVGRQLVMQVVARGDGWVRFQTASDSTKIADWLEWRSADVSWTDAGGGRTRVRWSLSYERRLDPAWYFGPWEDLVTTQAADYLIRSAAMPDAHS